ncbi:hypothetical protein SDC9_56660 [bioreactor metagenome]|uniref:Uncharacterized protein n=1 Tax=bioreactor metagenome TaxID=1076179 RepID=A0A644X363_9ZZZZ
MRDTLGKIDAAAHGYAVNRRNQANHEQHSVAHFGIRQLAGNEQVQNPKLLQKHIQANNNHKRSNHSAGIRTLRPASGQHLIVQPMNDRGYILKGDDIRIISDVGGSRIVADFRAFYASRITQFPFNLVLTAYAGHTADAQPNGFNS